jgi:hypothetical protein
MKTCTKCKEVKTLDRFSPGRNQCRDCRNKYRRQRYRDNPEPVKASVAQRRSDNPEYDAKYRSVPANKLRTALWYGAERATKLGNVVTDIWPDDQYAYWEAHGISKDHCHYCGVDFDGLERRQITIDHVEAIANGGPHVVENIVPACLSCNSSKKADEI